ncbi:MAG: NADP-dependent malic enzyme [Thermoplasmata archaeon]
MSEQNEEGERKPTVEELLAKARKPGEDALKLHPFYQGKIEVTLKAPVRSFDDFAIWYTPGVAESCKVVHEDVEQSYVQTNRWNTIAVVSDGTRVLGLGDIGPEAGLPVMEGKSLLFKYLGGVDAFPLCLATKDPEEIIQCCKWLEPSLGGINLEDISQPKCFHILDTLRKEMNIPVWHDDQQGTATISVAAAINSLKFVGKKWDKALFCMVGAGAANIATARVLVAAGVPIGNIIMSDSKGILHQGRKDIEERKDEFKEKWKICLESNAEGRTGGIPDAMKDTDICIAASKPGPGTIRPEWVSSMADDPVIFPEANPIPEIWPWEAKEAGAVIVATGRSDFPNQVNNSLGFPGIFRGTLDVSARTITDEMCIAAAFELAKTAEDNGIHADYVVPTMDEWEVFPREATAVALKAIEQGVARKKMSRQEIFEKAEHVIRRAREQTKTMMANELFIPPAPE